MSKCVPVLDGDKITNIQVKTKAQKDLQKDAPKPKDFNNPK